MLSGEEAFLSYFAAVRFFSFYLLGHSGVNLPSFSRNIFIEEALVSLKWSSHLKILIVPDLKTLSSFCSVDLKKK